MIEQFLSSALLQAFVGGTHIEEINQDIEIYQFTRNPATCLVSPTMDSTLFQKCFHGGAFFKSVGERFQSLERSRAIINADVLDAWFPPAPAVLDALEEYLPWLLRTSPPTHCTGLLETIAESRGIVPESILPGAGSSDLIFRVLREWLIPSSRVLLLDPTYGEYAHILEQVIGCRVARFTVFQSERYAVAPHRLHAVLQGPWDLVILVNPNSPTGRHIPRAELEAILNDIPASTRVWVDETYIDYAGPAESIERFAASLAQCRCLQIDVESVRSQRRASSLPLWPPPFTRSFASDHPALGRRTPVTSSRCPRFAVASLLHRSLRRNALPPTAPGQ